MLNIVFSAYSPWEDKSRIFMWN